MLRAQDAYGRHSAQISDGSLALGRNLYPTLPEDRFDKGPLARGKFRLVADVKLDNRDELAAALGLESGKLASLADSGLLFESLLKWGDTAVDRLVGQFAFAFWDGRGQRLLLARDFLGMRPLHFHEGKNFLAFASMPSGLHALPDVPFDFDPEFMSESLALLPHVGRKTYYAGIQRVEPAHLAWVTAEGIAQRCYWSPPRTPQREAIPSDYEEGLRDFLDQAVKAQLRGAGATVGSHLSGGLDSSIVTTSAAMQMAPRTVVAFTAVPRPGFEGPVPAGRIANEGELAAATAAEYPNIEHVLVESGGQSPFAALDREHHFQQQPIANLCNAVWGRQINRRAHARGLKVLLIGSAGNMSISYSGLEWLPWLLKNGRPIEALKTAFALGSGGLAWRGIAAQLIGPFLPRSLWEFALRRHGRVTDLKDYAAVNPRHIPSIEEKARERRFDLAYRPGSDPVETRLSVLLRTDGGNYFKGVLAEWGLSLLDPTADKRLIEYGLAVPLEDYVRGGLPRSLARRAFGSRLPRQVIEATHKGYQSADWYETLGQHVAALREEVDAIGRCASAAETMDFGWLQQAALSLPDNGWARDDVMMRYRYGLLRAIAAGHFMRKVAGTN
jgi:asparagine synthase (glutamine-hydrolysing)